MTILNIENLAFGVPEKKGMLTLLQNVSFSLQKGQSIGIVGESGSGKTTLGRCLMRLYEPTDGSIYFNDMDITHLSQKALRPIRRHMQMIFQDPLSSLNPRKQVWQLIGEGMLLHGLVSSLAQSKEKVQHLLEQVRLDSSYLTRYPHQLSGGQRQRIGIARAIAVQPQLIVADEVVSGLDVSSQAKVLNILMNLVKEYQLTLIFISHDLAVVRLMCEQLLVLYHGKVVEQGDSYQIFSNPQNDYTKRLIDAIPHIHVEDGWLSTPTP